jgi:hypothetical protein
MHIRRIARVAHVDRLQASKPCPVSIGVARAAHIEHIRLSHPGKQQPCHDSSYSPRSHGKSILSSLSAGNYEVRMKPKDAPRGTDRAKVTVQ